MVVAGVVAVRADPLADFLRFLGVRDDNRPVGVETYSQRTVLAYIGGRIFLDHPVVGVGWQRSDEPEAFLPYLDDARRRFPDVVEEAFPAPGRQWGVQSLYVQAAAELGLVGLGLLLGVLAAGAALAWRAARAAAVGWAGPALTALAVLAMLVGVWSALGMVAGIPLDAATWLALGLAVAAAASGGPQRADG